MIFTLRMDKNLSQGPIDFFLGFGHGKRSSGLWMRDTAPPSEHSGKFSLKKPFTKCFLEVNF